MHSVFVAVGYCLVSKYHSASLLMVAIEGVSCLLLGEHTFFHLCGSVSVDFCLKSGNCWDNYILIDLFQTQKIVLAMFVV